MSESNLGDLSWLDDLTESDMEGMTPGERIGLMWPMAVAEWRTRGVDVENQPFRRDIVRVIRRLPDGTVEIFDSRDP